MINNISAKINFSDKDKTVLKDTLPKIVDAVRLIVNEDIDRAMNLYN
jgi:hypothetical protein